MSIIRMPPSSSTGSRIDGTRPRTTSTTGANATAKNTTIGSRRNSLVSMAVSLNRADMVRSSGVDAAAGERDERVVERGLLHAQVGRGHLVTGKDGSHREQQVPRAGHDELPAGPLDGHDLGQRGQHGMIQRHGRAEPD